jgi:hypothetical protein
MSPELASLSRSCCHHRKFNKVCFHDALKAVWEFTQPVRERHHIPQLPHLQPTATPTATVVLRCTINRPESQQTHFAAAALVPYTSLKPKELLAYCLSDLSREGNPSRTDIANLPADEVPTWRHDRISNSRNDAYLQSIAKPSPHSEVRLPFCCCLIPDSSSSLFLESTRPNWGCLLWKTQVFRHIDEYSITKRRYGFVITPTMPVQESKQTGAVAIISPARSTPHLFDFTDVRS